MGGLVGYRDRPYRVEHICLTFAVFSNRIISSPVTPAADL